jgi:mono/diheme cytochrome c family protein
MDWRATEACLASRAAAAVRSSLAGGKLAFGSVVAIIFLLAASHAAAQQPNAKPADIATLVGDAVPAITVTVADPVYKKPKRYTGHALAGLLRKAWPDVERRAAQGAELVFHCADGYAPSMKLARALSAEGIVAVRDLDRPANDPWEPFTQGKETITPAPFYLVWRGIDGADANYKWPYQLVALSIEIFDQRYEKAAPPAGASAEVQHGFRLFVQHCASCHSVNLAGGDLGPELNVPRNVTEYWLPEHLAAFIRAPESYRTGSKMPGFGHLADAEHAAILAYLRAMRERKICFGAKNC